MGRINLSVYFAIVIVILCNFAYCQTWESGLKEKYDGYGEDWIFMPDGNDQPQVAVLKEANDERGIFDESQVSFLLYTRSGPENGTQLYRNDRQGLLNSNFKRSRLTKFITHGWKSSAMSSGLVKMKDEYLKYYDYNVIMVDWQPLAASTFYLGPMHNTKNVGETVAQFIDFLVRETGLKPKDVHFLGHSLGAHVAGNTGSSITSGRLGRITGLDPASPGFHLLASNKTKLDSTDALFVDIIHSCGGVVGFLQPLGSVDFYPNGGVPVQPGCCCIAELIEACSHGRSYVYLTESIGSKTGFVASKCNTWDNYVLGNCKNAKTTLMGEHVDKRATGSYFLMTRSEPPYAEETPSTDNMI
ncbi:Pancreatic triacylglycerol lipase [Habropoda laboriosa]|uniref:phospholipase A1 n=1 Tax=Habropoda laboriosa TaxID=597456 RepID=A0A0L7QY80_9HYME|nr:PREDICTED: pancreatic triacylglycerol lipase-like [Habropoda laboriosa]KOC63514.1 Pancreatic triacylglycerol lipase [Habropoda laboriosa]